MYRLLRLIFIGTWELPKKCEHNFEVHSSTNVDNRGPRGDGSYYVQHTLQCKKCGTMKIFKAI